MECHDVISDVHDNSTISVELHRLLKFGIFFNLLKKTCYKIPVFYSAVTEIKRLTETNCTRINAAHVRVKIIAG